MTKTTIPVEWVEAIAALTASGQRVILGLAGTPGSGKSSAAEAIAGHFDRTAVVVPMDGFHLAGTELARLGRAERKGAPDTFDVGGYLALLERIRRDDGTVYAPEFRRWIEEPVAGAIPVLPQHRLVITEGNYLLLWPQLRPLLDRCWFVDIDQTERIARLVSRHIAHGRTPDAAREWVLRSDEANATLIEATAARADRRISWPPPS